MLNSDRKLLQTTPVRSSNPLGQLINTHHRWDSINFGSQPRRAPQDHVNFRTSNGMEALLRGEWKTGDDSESGVCSPPLWRTSPPTSPQHYRTNYRCLSPTSRTQAIARGQRELMEMVRNMPESCYELSLKDLVENPKVLGVAEEREDSSAEILFNRENSKKKNEIRPLIRRSGSVDNGGFYLKMAFPISLGSTKNKAKKKNDVGLNGKVKFSAKPPITESDGSAKGVDKEWWKRRFSVSGESDSGGSSVNSGSIRSSGSSSSSRSSRSSSTRSIRRNGGGGCWFCINLQKVETPED